MDAIKVQNKIGKRIREVRLKKGMTQEELAKAMEKKRQVIQRLEFGSVNPSLYFLNEVAIALHVKLEELLQEF